MENKDLEPLPGEIDSPGDRPEKLVYRHKVTGELYELTDTGFAPYVR